MFTKEDIIARLEAGEDAQAIANGIADVLNDALKEHNKREEERAAEAARLKAEEEAKRAKDAEKVAEMENIMTQLCAFFAKYYDDEMIDDATIKRVSKDILNAMDQTINFASKFVRPVVKVRKEEFDNPDIDDDVLRKFLATL